MNLRTPLARARGLGSAKDGLHHWWMQRLTAVALVPLSIWFVAALVSVAGAGHAEVTAWIAQPLTAILLILTVVATFYHAALGLQVVFEDYIGSHLARVAAIIVAKLACVALATACVFSVVKIAVGG